MCVKSAKMYSYFFIQDDGTPMIACENCGVWQHIACLEKSGQVEKQKSLDDITFVCRKCEEEPQQKKQKMDHEQQNTHLPHIQSTIPPVSPILPPLINNNTHVQAQSPLEAQPTTSLPPRTTIEQLSPVVPRPVPIEPTVTPVTQSAPNVQQRITTAGLLPPVDESITVQFITPVFEQQPAVQQTLLASEAQHLIQQSQPIDITPSALTLPTVTAPSAPTIQTTAPADTPAGVCSSTVVQTQPTEFPNIVDPSTSTVPQP